MVISLDGFPAYALNDPRLPIPTLRRLAREGASAAAMQPINPTVTWPNHTTLVTGVDASRHQVLFNGLLTRNPAAHNPADHSMVIEPWRPKDLLVHAETVYDVAYQAGLTTAQVDWVAIYGARTITWSFAEQPDPNGPIESELVKAGVVTKDQLAKFDDSSPAWQDEIRTDAAVEIIKRHRPNLLLVHLLCLDDINHQYGPMSDASLEAMAFLDDRIKQISDTLTHSHQPYTLLIVSDHGFRKTSHAIYPNTLLRQQGLASDAWVVPDGGVAMVYVTNPSRCSELLPRLTTLFSGVEGVDRLYAHEDLKKLGLPTRKQSNQAPDLLIAAKPGNVFAGGAPDGKGEPNGGTHGYLNTDPQMQAIFMAWGSGIKPGVRLGTISNLDVAPTIAALLGIKLTNATGRPLTAILSDARTMAH